MTQLSDEDRAKVAAQVDHFIEVLERRYKLSAEDVVEAVRWVRVRKDFNTKLSMAGTASLLALVISAMAAALWEGVRSLVRIKGG